VVTTVVANRALIDGVAVVVQQPTHHAEEVAYLPDTVRTSYEHMDEARQRGLELLPHLLHRQSYKKRTESALAIVQQLEHTGHFPYANYAFDNGVLTVDLSRFIEQSKKHWVSELVSSRHIQWQGRWQRVDAVAAGLRQYHPESFRPVRVRCRNGEMKQGWVLTKVVRLKRYGRKRLVIVHEQDDLSDIPRFLLTDALHWDSGRVIETWSYRWASEIFHEFSKQVTGLEAAQVRPEEAVNRHLRFSCGGHWFRLMSDPHEQFCWTSRWCRVMLFRRAPSLLSGRDADDMDPHAMPLLLWEERRGTARLHHAMWRTTDPVPLCLLCTDFFRNTPYSYCPFENAHGHRGTSPGSPHSRGRYQRGDTPLWCK
jgi:hypothetical protein